MRRMMIPIEHVGRPIIFASPFIPAPRRRTATSSEFVKRARERLGMTQTELADKLGIERRTIIRYEREGFEAPQYMHFALRYLLGIQRKHRRKRD